MNPIILAPILEFGKALIDKFGPENPDEKRKIEFELLKMASNGELAIVLKQLEVNAVEAANPSIWTSGWRPYFGWVSGTGFAYAVLLQPLLAWAAALYGSPVPPVLDSELLWVVITGILGIGGLRSFDKRSGTSK